MNILQPSSLNFRRSLRRGFTLIELVLVLTIIIILVGSGIYIINQQGVLDTAQETRIDGDVQAVAAQLEVYMARNGRYPTTEQGLAALVEKPAKDPIPDRWTRLMDEIPQDPWKQPYKYRYPAQKSKKPYDIYSIGKNGQDEGGAGDDIGNWRSSDKK
jgi:general secretion pathway protein G